MIPYGKHEITEEDINSVFETLRSENLTQGDKVPHFEDCINKYCGSKYSVATNSATSALHIAYLALGLKAGDELWTSPITFAATSNAAIHCGATVNFIDIDPETYNLCPIKLEDRLVQARKMGKLPKVVVAVHMCGQSCDMESIFKLSKEYGFSIVEDASHAIGASYKGKYIGACTYSDITIFSFHPVKIITTGEGGIATTNRFELFNTMQRLRSHGITKNPKEMIANPEGLWFYEQQELGFNYRMTDISASLGISQLSRLTENVKTRNQIASSYYKNLSVSPIFLPKIKTDNESAFHLFTIRIKLIRNEVFEKMYEKGIRCQVHYIPVYKHPYYQKRGDYFLCSEAENYYKEALSLPIYVGLSESMQLEVIDCLLEFIK